MFESDNVIAIIGQKGIPKEFPGTSGIEAYVEKNALKLIKNGKSVRCYVRKWTIVKPTTNYRGIRIIIVDTVNTKFLDTITYSFQATLHAVFSDADAVWYQGIGPAFFAFIPRVFGKRIYTTIHSLDWKRKKWNIVAKLFLRICEFVTISVSDNILTVSSALQNYYSDNYNISTILDKHEIPQHVRTSSKIIQKKYHLKHNEYILYLGRFVPEKRIEWLIQASKNFSNIAIVIAGGSSHSEQYETYLRSISKGRNIVFTGYVFGREKAELLSNCKLFVLPSNTEGYPIVIAEAISYGRKCLIGNFLMNEYVDTNRLIYFFKNNSYRDFLVQLKKIIKK